MKMLRLLASMGLLIILILGITAAPVSAQNEVITLTPSSGFATTMVSGSGFTPNEGHLPVLIYWDSSTIPLPPIPLQVTTGYLANEDYGFTAIIAIPTPLAVGRHTVTAIVDYGDGITETAQTTFQVARMTGPQGETGAVGPAGVADPAGYAGTGIDHAVNNGNGTFTFFSQMGLVSRQTTSPGPEVLPVQPAV